MPFAYTGDPGSIPCREGKGMQKKRVKRCSRSRDYGQ